MPLPHHNKEDKELLQAFYADGNNHWLGILLQRYTTLLLGVSMKYLKNEEDAKDSVQQIFLKVIAELQKYKVDYFKSWLYMVAKNHCLMKLRDKHKTPGELNENLDYADDEKENRISIVEKENVLIRLEKAINGLNQSQRVCITLFYLQKKSYQQVAEQTGFSLLQVKTHIQNGKRNLKTVMQTIQKHD